MTKQEREKLVQKSQILDTLQNLLHNGLFPGRVYSEIMACKDFILYEWNAIQALIQSEDERVQKLIEEKEKKPKGKK